MQRASRHHRFAHHSWRIHHDVRFVRVTDHLRILVNILQKVQIYTSGGGRYSCRWSGFPSVHLAKLRGYQSEDIHYNRAIYVDLLYGSNVTPHYRRATAVALGIILSHADFLSAVLLSLFWNSVHSR